MFIYDYMSYHENHVNIKRKKLLDVILFNVKINFIREKKKEKSLSGMDQLFKVFIINRD